MERVLHLFSLWLPVLFKGALVTIEVSLIALIVGSAFGLLLSTLCCERLKGRTLSRAVRGYIYLIRGTPLFIQLLIVYYALPSMLGVNLSSFAAGTITLSLNSAAYLGEVLRGGLNAIPSGQWEVAQALGYSRAQALYFVILPQTIRNLLPTLTNEMTSLVKESSVLMVIGVHELTKSAKDLVATNLQPMPIYVAAGCIYLAMTSCMAWIARKGEEKTYAAH